MREQLSLFFAFFISISRLSSLSRSFSLCRLSRITTNACNECMSEIVGMKRERKRNWACGREVLVVGRQAGSPASFSYWFVDGTGRGRRGACCASDSGNSTPGREARREETQKKTMKKWRNVGVESRWDAPPKTVVHGKLRPNDSDFSALWNRETTQKQDHKSKQDLSIFSFHPFPSVSPSLCPLKNTDVCFVCVLHTVAMHIQCSAARERRLFVHNRELQGKRPGTQKVNKNELLEHY